MGNTIQEMSIGTLTTNEGVGDATSGLSVTEYGDSRNHTTVINTKTKLGAIAGGAALALGKLLYTFPVGEIVVNSIKMSVAITQTESNIDADTPDVGLGTDLATGAYATLSACDSGETLTTENILTGQTAADCDGTATVLTLSSGTVIATAADHEVYFNVADTWAADGDAGALLTGEVVINWTKM